MVANIAKVSLRQPNSKLIRALSRESDVLEQQRQAFASVSSNILIACFYEEMPTSFRKILGVNLGVVRLLVHPLLDTLVYAKLQRGVLFFFLLTYS